MSKPMFFGSDGKRVQYKDVPSFTEVGTCRNCGKVAGLDIYPAFKGCCKECKDKGIELHLSFQPVPWMIDVSANVPPTKATLEDLPLESPDGTPTDLGNLFGGFLVRQRDGERAK